MKKPDVSRSPSQPKLILLAGAALAIASPSHAAVVASTQESATVVLSATPWASRVTETNNDLIHSGASTLGTGHTFGAVNAGFPVSGLNNGTAANQPSGTGNTWIQGGAGGVNHFTGPGGTWAATFNLNLNPVSGGSALGYNITSIESFMGWGNSGSQIQGNQTYTVAVSLVSDALGTFTDIATVNYVPFATDIAGANYNTHVILTENTTGILASGVRNIRFTFLNPYTSVTNNTGLGFDGTLIQELNVFGQATPVPEPSVALLGGLSVLALLRRRRD